MARKPSAVARELLRNLPKSGGGKKRRRRSKRSREDGEGGEEKGNGVAETELIDDGLEDVDLDELDASLGGNGNEGGAVDLDELEPASAPVSEGDHGDDERRRRLPVG